MNDSTCNVCGKCKHTDCGCYLYILERKHEDGDFAAAWKLVGSFFNNENGNKTYLWFMTPNPLLGNIEPICFVKNGRSAKLLKFVENLLYGNLP